MSGCVGIVDSGAGSYCVAHKTLDPSNQRASGVSRGYSKEWVKQSAKIRARWIRDIGYICPGWEINSHESKDLVVDHDDGVMCRSCNGRKAALLDRVSDKPKGGDRALPDFMVNGGMNSDDGSDGPSIG